MEGFQILLLAHLIGDFPLQTPWVYAWKIRSVWGLMLHTLLHVAAVLVLVQDAAQFWRLWLVLGVAHFITDWYKMRVLCRRAWVGFLLDQCAHVAVLGLLAWGRPGLRSVLPLPWMRAALWYGLLPAVLMFAWVYAADRQDERSPVWRWVRASFVRYSQVNGYALVLGVLYLLYGMS